MKNWRILLRCSALILLLGAAADIFVIDTIVPNWYDESAPQSGTASQRHHDCFCCCAHLVLESPQHFPPIEVSTDKQILVTQLITNAEPAGMDHPPRT